MMNKIRLQFEADTDGNVLRGQTDDGFKIAAKVEVPDGASEDYGYLTMKTIIVEEIHMRELEIECEFPYDGQERFLANDVDVDADVEIDITD